MLFRSLRSGSLHSQNRLRGGNKESKKCIFVLVRVCVCVYVCMCVCMCACMCVFQYKQRKHSSLLSLSSLLTSPIYCVDLTTGALKRSLIARIHLVDQIIQGSTHLAKFLQKLFALLMSRGLHGPQIFSPSLHDQPSCSVCVCVSMCVFQGS